MTSRVSTKRKQRPKGKPAGRHKAVKASRAKPSKVKPSTAKPSKAKATGRRSAPDPLDEFIIGAARALSLEVEQGWMPAVRTNLRVTLAQAALVSEFALPDEAEPAPVFKA